MDRNVHQGCGIRIFFFSFLSFFLVDGGSVKYVTAALLSSTELAYIAPHSRLIRKKPRAVHGQEAFIYSPQHTQCIFYRQKGTLLASCCVYTATAVYIGALQEKGARTRITFEQSSLFFFFYLAPFFIFRSISSARLCMCWPCRAAPTFLYIFICTYHYIPIITRHKK